MHCQVRASLVCSRQQCFHWQPMDKELKICRSAKVAVTLDSRLRLIGIISDLDGAYHPIHPYGFLRISIIHLHLLDLFVRGSTTVPRGQQMDLGLTSHSRMTVSCNLLLSFHRTYLCGYECPCLDAITCGVDRHK